MGNYWIPSSMPHCDALDKWVEENVLCAVENAVEEEGAFLLDFSCPGVEIAFLSWEMPMDRRVFSDDGRVKKDLYMKKALLEDLVVSEAENFGLEKEEKIQIAEKLENIAAKIREAAEEKETA